MNSENTNMEQSNSVDNSTENNTTTSANDIQNTGESNSNQAAETPIDNPKVPMSGEVISKYSSEDEYQKAVNKFDNNLELLSKTVEATYDWKEIKQRISDTKDQLKALFFKEDDNDRIVAKLDDLLQRVNERQVEEKDKFDKESEENYSNVKDKVDAAIKEVAESDDFKTAREKLVKAQDLFRGIRLKKSHRDELFDKVNLAFDELNKRQIEERENFEMETIENYHNLKAIIEAAIKFAKESTNFAKAREKLIEAQSHIKGKKLKRDQREELYQIIRENFEELNLRQNEEREQFEEETKVNYNNLRKLVDDAVEFAKSTNDFKQARDQLMNAQAAIKDLKLKRNQRDELYGNIREVFSSLNNKQSEEREEFESEAQSNYELLTKKVNDAFEQVYGLTDFKMIRETLISVQGEVKILKLKKNHRNELFSRIREAFSIFDKKKEEYFDQRRTEKIEKLTSIQTGLNEKIERLSTSIKRDIENLEQANNSLENEKSASNDEIQIADLEKNIKSLENKIKDKEKSIAATEARIKDIQKDIDKLAKKMERKENKQAVKEIIQEKSPIAEQSELLATDNKTVDDNSSEPEVNSQSEELPLSHADSDKLQEKPIQNESTEISQGSETIESATDADSSDTTNDKVSTDVTKEDDLKPKEENADSDITENSKEETNIETKEIDNEEKKEE